ncbi:MAG: hypothetical protein ACK4TA_24590, partial [Saprospiraceae bacterium]
GTNLLSLKVILSMNSIFKIYALRNISKLVPSWVYKLEIGFDEQILGYATLKDGFDFFTNTTVGKHRITIRFMVNLATVSKLVDIPQIGEYEAKLKYHWQGWEDERFSVNLLNISHLRLNRFPYL